MAKHVAKLKDSSYVIIGDVNEASTDKDDKGNDQDGKQRATYANTPEVNNMSESEQQVNGSGKRQKRGPFLPVNSSMSVSEDNDVELLADNDNDYYLKQQTKTRISTNNSRTSASNDCRGGRLPTHQPQVRSSLLRMTPPMLPPAMMTPAEGGRAPTTMMQTEGGGTNDAVKATPPPPEELHRMPPRRRRRGAGRGPSRSPPQ